MEFTRLNFQSEDGNSIAAELPDSVVPFLKWAGGKRWLAPFLRKSAPEGYGTFIEPFLGGAATFFALQPRVAILSDVNTDLIECYKAIRENWHLVVRYLLEHQRNHNKTYYYEMRATQPRSDARRAARFIYLNRTCWNGLYRVNLRGKFNVPKGTKKAVVMPSDNFEKTASLLENAGIFCCDFESTIDKAEKGDFVFVDPPYTVRHNNNNFIKYNEQLFSWADQIRLRDVIERATKRGAKVLVTNADHKSIRMLYKQFPKKKSIPRQSILSGDASYRSLITELVIQCWS